MGLLGLDIGTSACKAAVFDEDGSLLAVASREYSGDIPRPGWIEMDPDRLWNAAVDCTREASSASSEPVQALAVSSQGETFIPVDKNGRAVGSAIMNADNRATEQVRLIEESLGKEGVYAITGCVLHPMYALPKIMWLKENARETYDKAAKFLSVGDYLLALLGVQALTDYSLASRTMAFDVTRRESSDRLLSVAGIEEDRFPEASPSGTVAGVLSASVAEPLGLRKGTVVAVGGHDQPCGALGAGVVGAGDAADSAGSYECLIVASDRPVLGPEALASSLNSYCHVVPDKYVTLAFFPAGVVVRWFRDQFAAGESYDDLGRHLPEGPSGICFTPHFIGSGNPTWNVHATGAVVGLTPDRTSHHVFKSILEGIACEIKINAAVMEKTVGKIDLLRTFGGGAKSDYWLQLRADITGKSVASMTSPEAVCLGAAVLAGVGVGVYPDAQSGAGIVSKFAKVYEPNINSSLAYADQIARYEKLYPALADSGVY